MFESRPEGRKEVGCAGTSVKSISGRWRSRCKVLGWEDVAEKGQEAPARAETHRPV